MNYVDLLWQHAAAFLTVCVVSMVLTYGATVWAVRDPAAYGPGREAEMMQELFAQPYFGVLLTIAAYWAGMKIQPQDPACHLQRHAAGGAAGDRGAAGVPHPL